MKTLRELEDNVRGGQPLEIQLGDFLDAFYLGPRAARVQEPPALLAGANPQGAMIDALLAAVAEYLCRRFSLPIPAWVYEPCRYLERPFFALTVPGLSVNLAPGKSDGIPFPQSFCYRQRSEPRFRTRRTTNRAATRNNPSDMIHSPLTQHPPIVICNSSIRSHAV